MMTRSPVPMAVVKWSWCLTGPSTMDSSPEFGQILIASRLLGTKPGGRHGGCMEDQVRALSSEDLAALEQRKASLAGQRKT